MGFAVIVPNAGQSPGLFPTQANNNFQRIFDVVNAEHVFSTLTAANQGCHRQVTFINRADPSTLPAGTNAIAFSKADTLGRAQLWWYNGVQTEQVTSREDVTTFRVQGSSLVNVAAGSTFNVSGMPTEYVAAGWVFINGTVTFSYQNIMVINGATDTHVIDSQSLGPAQPTFVYSGTQLQVKNNSGTPQTLVWSLMVNKLS